MNKILLFVLCALSGIAYSQIPTNSLVSKWEFTGNANDPVGGNNGTVNGATLTHDRFFNCNSAYAFDGINDYITMPSGGPTGNGSRSLCFWAKTANTTIQTAFGYGAIGIGALYQVLFNHSCQGVGFDVSNVMLMRGNPSIMLNNNWHHYAVVIDANVGTMVSNVIFYVDGAQITNTLCGNNSSINTGSGLPIQIGKDPNAMARYFSGTLDDFYFYNRALSLAEVQAIYNDTSTDPYMITVTGNTLVCEGSTQTYVASSASVSPSYTWASNGPFIGISNSNTYTALFNPAPPGNYTISVTIPKCASVLQQTSLAITVAPLPTVIASSMNDTICRGQTAVISAAGASSYVWLPNSATSQSFVASPSVTTVYTVTGTTANGCSASAITTLSVLDCTGIDGLNVDHDRLEIYPNPAHQYFYIEGGKGKLFIYDVTGNLVKEAQIDQDKQNIHIEHLPNGIYTLKLKNKEVEIYGRIIKK